MLRIVGIAAAVVVAATGGAWAGEPAASSSKEHARVAEQAKSLVGKWRMAVLRCDGEDVPKDANPETEFTFRADRTLVVQQFKPDGALLFEGGGTYQVDLSASSPQVRVVYKSPPGEPAGEASEWYRFEVRADALSIVEIKPVDEIEAALADESEPLPPAHVHEMVLNRVPAE